MDNVYVCVSHGGDLDLDTDRKLSSIATMSAFYLGTETTKSHLHLFIFFLGQNVSAPV